MVTFKIKRVYDPESPEDGYRIFVDRLWPRGFKKENLHYDLWDKELAPSSDLRAWFHADPDDRWEQFAELYQKELAGSHAADSIRDKVGDQKMVTLLYAAHDSEHNHALVLADYLRNHF